MVRYLSKRDAAATLGVSVKTIERRIKAGTLRRTIVHGPHGPEVRIALDDAPATIDVAPPPTDEPATPAPVPAVYHVAPPTLTLDRSDRELAELALRALEDVRAERDALRAVVESLRRPWWRKGWEKVRGKR